MSQDTPVQTAPAFPLEGGCACGNIRYALKTAPLVVHCCHCTSCQRETGTAFALNAVVEGDEVALLPGSAAASGAATLITFPDSILDKWTPRQSSPSGPGPGSADDGTGSSDGQTRDDVASPILIPVPAESGVPQTIARCPVCLTAVWSNYGSVSPIKYLRVGTLDSPGLLGGPDVYIFLRSRLPHVEVPDDGKPRFDGFFPQKQGVWNPEALIRMEKLGVRIQAWREEMRPDG